MSSESRVTPDRIPREERVTTPGEEFTALVGARQRGDDERAKRICQELHDRLATEERGEEMFHAEAFLMAYYHEDIEAIARGDNLYLSLSWPDLAAAAPEIADRLLEEPADWLGTLKAGLKLYDYGDVDLTAEKPHVRIRDLPDRATASPGDERAADVMTLLQMRGQVVKRSDVQPQVDTAMWYCRRCHEPYEIEQGYGKLREPVESWKCCERKTASYRLDKTESQWVDYQVIRLQELPEELSDGTAESIDLYLTEDLARRGIESGEQVDVTALYSPIRNKGKTVFRKMFDVNEISVRDEQADSDTDANREAIDDIAQMHDPVPMLADAALPSHEGDLHLKEALILQLVRGNYAEGAGGKEYRGAIHLGMIGDPGTGKTNFGDALLRWSPRAAKASGNEGTSAAGLTAAMTKDSFSENEWTFTAGTVPRASGGGAFIDEIDKASPSEQDSLLEAMESGKITLEKNGQNATFAADTSILAAGNPVNSHFQEDVPVVDQIDIGSALLTRFDLIFCPRERTERQTVADIADTILDGWDVAVRQDRETDVDDDLREDVEADVDEDVLEQYLLEVRQLEPVIPDAEKKALRDYYVKVKTELSRRDPDGERFPVTPRSLLDLLTLASASAKARMSETIEMVDVERTTRLMTRSFVELGLDPDESAVVEVDDDGTATVDSGGSPEAVLKEVVDNLKFEGSDYGADRERVLERATPDVDSRSKAELDAIVETMLEAETLHSASDGRLS